jgi:hypothetical protein
VEVSASALAPVCQMWNEVSDGVSGEIYHFDTNGLGRESTYECGPWELDEMPFEEREALFRQKVQTLVVGQKVEMVRYHMHGGQDCT